MQRGGGAVYRHRMISAAIGRQFIFKARHLRTLRKEVRAQDGYDGVDVLLGNFLATVGNHVLDGANLHVVLCDPTAQGFNAHPLSVIVGAEGEIWANAQAVFYSFWVITPAMDRR